MDIKLCMGSACFVRGNAENLSYLEKFIEDKGLDAKVELVGCRCKDCCGKGPIVTINGKDYTKVNIAKIKKVLDRIESKV